MKKTSLALLIGLIAIGCEKAPQKAGNNQPPHAMPDPAMMAKHMAPPGGAHAPAAEEKKDEAKPEGDAATPPAAEEKPAEEKKE